MSPLPSCTVLIATCGRWGSLLDVSLRSICRQTVQPNLVLLVVDHCELPPRAHSTLSQALAPGQLILMENARTPGAAGAWNTGLAYLAHGRFDGFVALLDDDDAWDPQHLEANLRLARQTGAKAVVSGLRLIQDGVLRKRALPQDLSARSFLTGNPGWQGSNTFVSLDVFLQVGGFRDGLQSLNDRDLAWRLLSAPNVPVAYTGQWTASWYLDSSRQTLSTPGAAAKLQGLRWFWHLYAKEMTAPETEAFFGRALALFGFSREQILSADEELPPHCETRGDLRC